MRTCLVICLVLFTGGKATEPCCKTCESGKSKFYSIPDGNNPNSECGEFCAFPSRYKLWKIFEPKLLPGDCASQGFTAYKSTETDGVWPLACTNDRYVRPTASLTASGLQFCPRHLKAVFADMHDGDKKLVTIDGTSLTITPSGNNQTWVVKSQLDTTSCSASIDFNVEGKPNPPPVNLLATLWYAQPRKTQSWKGEFTVPQLEFTDPSGKLASSKSPLNLWVPLFRNHKFHVSCPTSLNAIYSDMHDGDKKEITITGTSMTIKPSGNNQTWVVNAHVDHLSCSAEIDFNVPGKPNPPPVNLRAALSYDISATSHTKTEFEFTDPSGKLASADFPLNKWVENNVVELKTLTPEIVV